MLLQMALFHYFYGWVIFHCKQLTHWKSPWSWERLRAEGEEGIRGWDGWMASPMQWTCCCCCKSLQSCLTLCDPIDGSHQAPPSLGFSMQEHWKRLPFPSPMHESEKWKWSRSVVSDPSRPYGLQPTRLLLPWDFPGKSTGVECHCLLQQWTWTCANSRRWCGTARPGMLQSMGSQRVGHDWETDQQQQKYSTVCMYHIFFIHSSVNGCLGCFHILAIVNIAATNIGIHVYFLIS